MCSPGGTVATQEHDTPGARLADDGKPSLRVRAVWRTGPRTRAWDELWRWLFSDLPAESDAAAASEPER